MALAARLHSPRAKAGSRDRLYATEMAFEEVAAVCRDNPAVCPTVDPLNALPSPHAADPFGRGAADVGCRLFLSTTDIRISRFTGLRRLLRLAGEGDGGALGAYLHTRSAAKPDSN